VEVVPSDKPPDKNIIAVRSIKIDSRELEPEFGRYAKVWSTRQWKKEVSAVRTMYKRKDRKVIPMDAPLPGGVNPGGRVNSGSQLPEGETWRGNGDELELWRRGGTVVPRGSRLTPERLSNMRIGTGLLSEAEKQLFIDILFEYEGAIAFDDSEMGMLKPEIEPPIVIHTVPHKPWQQHNLRLPKAVQEIATEQVKEKLTSGLLEYSQGPYRSRYFLVPKAIPGEYQFINGVQQLNKVTIRDAGMPPAVDEFSEEFAGYPITTSVDYYSGYNQLLLDKESRDLMSFFMDAGLVRQT